MNKDMKTTHVEPAGSRSMLEWTPGLLRAARSVADGGSLGMAADFCEAAMADDRVQAALATRCRGLLSLPLSFEAGRSGGKAATNALEAGEDWWTMYPEAELAQLLAWGVMLGVGIGQHVWTPQGDRLLPRLKVWHPRHLRFDTQARTWRVMVEGGTEVDVVPGDGKWVLFMPYGESRPWQLGAWRAIGSWLLLKQYAIQDWARYSERHGQGLLVATSPEQGSKAKRQEIASDLASLGAEASFALPPGYSLELVESMANSWETFRAQKDAADMGIAVALLGQNMSTEVTGPVGTGATLHGRVMQVLIDADASTLSTCLHAQSLTWWALFNFGTKDVAPWPRWETTPKEEGQVFKYHLDYGVLTKNEIRARLGYAAVEGGDVPPEPIAGATGGDEPSEKSAAAVGMVRTKAGRLVRSSSGFVRGQLYADAVADTARDRAAKVLDEDVVAVLEAIEGGQTYEEIRARLLKTYRGMSPDKVAKLVESAFVMAELGGRHAVNEDL